MARRNTPTSISVPPELKARMAAVKENVNWSAVACRAFEQVLADIIKRKGAEDMNEVIERLRASRQRTEERRAREGIEAGRQWAMKEAEAEQLERLADFYERVQSDSWGWGGFFDPPPQLNPFSGAQRLAFEILELDEEDWDDGASKQFWRSAIGDDGTDITSEFAESFVVGALEIWDQVKNKL
jgi:hypothetical protein